MRSPEQLLADHQPYLRYDSHEAYFADAAQIFTDSPGNTLKRADGTLLAKAGADLSLALLGEDPYPDGGGAAAATDKLGVPDREYRKRAGKLHAQPEYANVVYGRVVTDGAGARWLQYWCFYFFNDYNLIGGFVHAGLHEGDWEMVQIRLGSDDRPDHAVYAQHAHAQGRPWDEVERVPGTQRPVVYVARGSHAAYFEPGTQFTGVWLDYADGKRQSPERQRLEVVADGAAQFAWMHWPGRWGDTPKKGGIAPADSPRSPGVRKHWRDPLELLKVAAQKALEPVAARPVPPPPPAVSAAWDGDAAMLSYAVVGAAGGQVPALLTVTVNSKDDAGPPDTVNVPIDAVFGAVELPGLDAHKRYDIYVSRATAKGLPSESVRLDLMPPGR